MKQSSSFRIRYWSTEAILYQVIFALAIIITGYISDAWMADPIAFAITTTFTRLKFGSPLFLWQIINILISSGVGIFIG